MLKKANRLTISRHFKRAYEKGKNVPGQYVRMRAFRNLNSTQAPAKIAVVISKKVFPHAVDRNLWRRRAKAVSRDFVEKLNGWEVVINFNGAIKEADYSALKEDLKKCFANLQSS